MGPLIDPSARAALSDCESPPASALEVRRTRGDTGEGAAAASSPEAQVSCRRGTAGGTAGRGGLEGSSRNSRCSARERRSLSAVEMPAAPAKASGLR